MNREIKPYKHTSLRPGFTLVELMLAMAFVAVLLIAISMTMIQISTIFNKGMALKEVNETSRQIATDIQRNFLSAGNFNYATDYLQTPAGGRLCLGNYSYVWNTAYAHVTYGADDLIKYDPTVSSEPIHLVRVPDAGRIYCLRDSEGNPLYKNLRLTDSRQARSLVQTADSDGSTNRVMVLAFDVPSNAAAYDSLTGQGLYSVDYRLGTGNISAMTTGQTACLPPIDGATGIRNITADLTYCNVQQFSIVVKTGSRG